MFKIEDISNYPLREVGEIADILDSKRIPVNGTERAKRQGPYPYYGANGPVGTIDDFIFDDELVLVAEDGGFFFDKFKPISYRVSGKCWVNNHAHILRAIDGLDTEWLNYSICLQDIRHLVNGATRPKLTQRDLRKIKIPVPSLDDQRRIVARIQECLSRVEEMERLQAEVAEDAESFYGLSVSRIIEALREKYPSDSVGNLVSGDKKAMRSGPFGSAMKHDEFVPEGNLVIGIANVQGNRFDPVRKWMITDEKYEEMSRYEVAPGDVLITIMGTIGRTCVVPRDIGKAITSKHVYRIRFPNDKVVPEYVSFLINFDFGTKHQLYGSAAGGVMPGLNATKLRNLEICLPRMKFSRRRSTNSPTLMVRSLKYRIWIHARNFPISATPSYAKLSRTRSNMPLFRAIP